MNASRRKRIGELIGALRELQSSIEMIGEEEREAYEALPDSIKDGERGQASEAAADRLDEAARATDDVADLLEEAHG